MSNILISIHVFLWFLISSESHRKNVHKYWWENGADKNLKSKFLVDKEMFNRFVFGLCSFVAQIQDCLIFHKKIIC